MKQVRYAVIGCGMISKFHIAAIHDCPEAQLAGVYSSNSASALKTAKEYGTYAYPSAEALWKDKRVDAVCICTPSGYHACYAMEAIRHDKHVLIEKPMALTVAECDQIIHSAKEHHVLVGVVCQLRFAPAVAQVKKAMDQKLLGKLICADLYMKYHRSQAYYDSSPWRGTWKLDGGGALMNQGIHGVDLLSYLVGPVDNIFARSKTLVRNIEVEDTLSAVTEFRCGAIGVIQATTSLYSGFSRRLELCGEKGTIILEEDKIRLWDVEGCPMPLQELPDESEIRGYSDPGNISTLGHLHQITNFTAAVLDRTPLLNDGIQGRETLRIILGAYRSAAENRAVKISEI